MANDEKVELIKQMLTDFWGCRDEITIDAAEVMLEMIGTVLDFGGKSNGE